MVWLTNATTPPDMRIYAIGDIHGCLNELKEMHEAIVQDLEARPIDQARVIHVGDYVDRGPDSKGVIDYLIDLCAEEPKAVCLLGNHDEMCGL